MSDTAGRFQPNNLLIRCAKDLAAVLGAAVSGATDETSVTVDMSDCDRRLSATVEDRGEDGRGEDGRGVRRRPPRRVARCAVARCTARRAMAAHPAT